MLSESIAKLVQYGITTGLTPEWTGQDGSESC